MEVTNAVTVLMAAIAQSHSGKEGAFVRAAARACLQAGLSKEGPSYILTPVPCAVVRSLIQANSGSSPGKLMKRFGTSANSQYFKVLYRAASADTEILAKFPALIFIQHRTAKVQAILPQIISRTPKYGSTMTTTPRHGQDVLQTNMPQAAPDQQQALASQAGLTGQQAADTPAPPQQQRHALATAEQMATVQQSAFAQQQAQAQQVMEQCFLPATQQARAQQAAEQPWLMTGQQVVVQYSLQVAQQQTQFQQAAMQSWLPAPLQQLPFQQAGQQHWLPAAQQAIQSQQALPHSWLPAVQQQGQFQQAQQHHWLQAAQHEVQAQQATELCGQPAAQQQAVKQKTAEQQAQPQPAAKAQKPARPTKSNDGAGDSSSSSQPVTKDASSQPSNKVPYVLCTGSSGSVLKLWPQCVKAKQIAVDCEGCKLSRTGQLTLVQVFVGSTCYLFDMLQITEPFLQQLKSILEDLNVTKVMHDCRQDSAALFYQFGIKLHNVLDTQVACGLIGFWDGILDVGHQNQPQCGLAKLLQKYDLAPHTTKQGMKQAMKDDPSIWQRRPLSKAMLRYAAEDVSQLLLLADKLSCELGAAELRILPKLSKAYAQWYWDAADRDGAQPDSYSARASLPLNVDLEMTFPIKDGVQSYKPKFELPSGGQAEQSSADHQAAADTEAANDASMKIMLDLLPREVGYAVAHSLQNGRSSRLVEIVADADRHVLLRFGDGTEVRLAMSMDLTAALQELQAVGVATKPSKSFWQWEFGSAVTPAGDAFHADNRMGLTGTLHRISAIRDRDGSVVGLTYRIGRHVAGVGNLLWDILATLGQSSKDSDSDHVCASSLLLLGHPGVGKTTLLRDVTGLLAERFGRRVVVVDTSNEIGGDGKVPHSCIGRARRMPVPHKSRQHEVLQEAVQNHNPEIVVVDEIGSPAEAAAVRGIAQRGVAMVGTAHGTDLSSLLANPDLNSLIGGVHQVTLGDAEARLRNNGNKTRTERKGLPPFSCLVEVLSHTTWRVHLNVAASVDALLANKQPTTQLRQHKDGKLIVRFETPAAASASASILSQQEDPWLASLFQLAKSMRTPAGAS